MKTLHSIPGTCEKERFAFVRTTIKLSIILGAAFMLLHVFEIPIL